MREVLGSIPRAALCPQLCRCWPRWTSFGSQFGKRRGAYERSAILNLKIIPEAYMVASKLNGQSRLRACQQMNRPTSDALAGVEDSSISGLVVEYIVAIDVTRVRFPADAFLHLNGETTQVLNDRLTCQLASWCNWLALWSLKSAIRVRIPARPFCVSPRTTSPLLTLAAWSSGMILA